VTSGPEQESRQALHAGGAHDAILEGDDRIRRGRNLLKGGSIRQVQDPFSVPFGLPGGGAPGAPKPRHRPSPHPPGRPDIGVSPKKTCAER